jgi:maltose/moltooligosaccharide transporter
LSFLIGASVMVLAVAWTALTVREYSPAEMAAFEGTSPEAPENAHQPLVYPARGAVWMVFGAIMVALVAELGLDKQLYVLGGGLLVFGLAQIVLRAMRATGALAQIMSDLAQMPDQMRQLAAAQFFTWTALFIMWIYTTPVVTQYAFGTRDTASAAYNAGADWVGVMFAFYNGVAALAAFALPLLARRIGNAKTHMVCLLAGAAGFLLLLVLHDRLLLLVPMVFVGIAWASILAMPYVILTRVLPPRKFGIYIGVFNVFIVVPQLMVATIMGGVIRSFFPGEPRWTMLVAAAVMAAAALTMLRVREDADAA